MIRIIGAIVALVLAIGGGIALYLYVQGAERRAAEGAEFEQVYIVTQPVPQGTPGEAIADFLEVDELPALAIQPDIVTDLTDLEGLVANADLLPGEQLLEARFSSPEDLAENGEVVVPAGFQEITLALPVERVVGGEVQPGSTVGVIISTNTRTLAANDLTASSQFVYNQVLVTRVTPGRTLVQGESDDESREVSAFLVTVAVSTPQAEKLAYAAEQQEDGNGGIWLTLQPEDVATGGSTNRSGGNIFQ